MAPSSDRGRRVAAFATLPFQLRGLAPIAQRFESWVLTSSIDAIEAFGPDMVLANDAGSFAMLRQYCDRHFAWLIGLRHGIANKYIGPDPEFALADYVCASDWDVADFERHGIRPIRGMLVTGNPWVDDVFRVAPRQANALQPSILFAPTWNPETSAAAFFDQDLVGAIRAVYPDSRIVIKPHPLMISPDHETIQNNPRCERLFARWVDSYRRAAQADPRVCFVDDPAMSIAAVYPDADILVSDGSSLVFEFALFERPILLYTNGAEVPHWSAAWDANAPANAMRDVGDQFTTRPEFEAALRDAFTRHARTHKARQRNYALQLHGQYRDGRSAERAAAALHALPCLDVTVASRRPNPQFVADVENTLRNTRVRVVAEDLPQKLDGNSLTLRPSAIQRLVAAHFVSYATRSSGQLPASDDLAAPMLSFAGTARPVDDEWVQADQDVRVIYSCNSPRPAWQRHLVASIDVVHEGHNQTRSAIVDATRNPFEIRVHAPARGSVQIGRRRFVPTDELVERACSDPEAARLLIDREMREATAWRSAETAIAHRIADHGTPLSLFECLTAWLAIDLKAQGVRTVAIFGAGSHTSHLLPVWRQWRGPHVRTILVSDSSTSRPEFQALPVMAVEDMDVTGVDAVVLSSASHEGSMADACERFVPELPVHAIWHHSDRTGPTSPADRLLYAIRRIAPFAIAHCRRDGIGHVALAGTSTERQLAAAVWRAWDGPEIARANGHSDATIWCSPNEGVRPRATGRSIHLWPRLQLPVAPGLLPRHLAAS